MSAQTKTYAFRLYPEDVCRLNEICSECGVTQAEALRLAIHQFDPTPKGVGRAIENNQQYRRVTAKRSGEPMEVRTYPINRTSRNNFGKNKKSSPTKEAAATIDMNAEVSSEWEKLSW